MLLSRIDEHFAKNFLTTTINKMHVYQQCAHEHIKNEMNHLSSEPLQYPLNHRIFDATPINVIKAQTEWLLWHQQSGHINLLIVCQNSNTMTQSWIDAPHVFNPNKQKHPMAIHSATIPYQGLSIDFSLSRTKSKNASQTENHEGINGKTSWILIS